MRSRRVRRPPAISHGTASFLWAFLLAVYIWAGLLAVGVSQATSVILGAVFGFLIFLYVRLLVAPVQQCPRQGRALCEFPYFTIASWYARRPGPSFLIVDPPQGLSSRPPSTLGRPSEVDRIGPEVTVYLYPRDIAPLIRR